MKRLYILFHQMSSIKRIRNDALTSLTQLYFVTVILIGDQKVLPLEPGELSPQLC